MTKFPIIVSSTEPKWLTDLGESSTFPEEFGADILLEGPKGYLGIQRKLYPQDLIQSVDDGRIAEQLLLLSQLPYATILFEGEASWTTEGAATYNPTHKYKGKKGVKGVKGGKGVKGAKSSWGMLAPANSAPDRFTRQAFHSMQASIHAAGVHTQWTVDKVSFVKVVQDLHHWWKKPNHSLGNLKPPEVKDARDMKAARTAAALQVVRGVGPTMARNIAAKFPLVLECETEDLLQIEGVGPNTAKAIIEQFGLTFNFVDKPPEDAV